MAISVSLFLFFFFSSRRRHTRFDCDWSSDVCSSDLNEPGERAVIDSIVNAFLVAHPEVVFTISAGNDGPGLSTVGLPGSADLAVSVGAALPGIYVPLEQDGAPPVAGGFVGSLTGRGGRVREAPPLAPGGGLSALPPFRPGNAR